MPSPAGETEPAEDATADAAPGETAPDDAAPAAGVPGQNESGSEGPARGRSCRCTTTSDGRFQLRYNVLASVGALVEAALKEAKDALFLVASGDSEPAAPGQWDRASAPEIGSGPRHRGDGPARPTPTPSKSWRSDRSRP